MSIISDVFVKGISLVMGSETPAVPHAKTEFAILKTTKNEVKRLEAVEKMYREISAR